MEHKEVRVFEVKSYDRYIFVTIENDKVIGINFHQGIGDLDYLSFNKPNAIITAIYMDMCGDCLSSVDTYNEACERYWLAMSPTSDEVMGPDVEVAGTMYIGIP